jgi:hypothetical protein
LESSGDGIQPLLCHLARFKRRGPFRRRLLPLRNLRFQLRGICWNRRLIRERRDSDAARCRKRLGLARTLAHGLRLEQITIFNARLGRLVRRRLLRFGGDDYHLALELHPDAILFRNRSGNPYREDTLSDDFAAARELTFPSDKRRLMDMRRSGVVEAIAGEIGPIGLAAKLANSIERSNTLHKTYAPVDIEAVRNADAARLKGRQRMRAENETGAKVSKQQPAGVSNGRRRER